jgi:hypothetical protein
MPELFFHRDVPPAVRSTIHNLLSEVAQHRPLTQDEIRLRRRMAPQPWLDLGCDRSTFYRRRRRALLSAPAEAA